jgi:hypothetical protein
MVSLARYRRASETSAGQAQTWGGVQRILQAKKCNIKDSYGKTASKMFDDALKTMEKLNLDHVEL